MARWTCTRVTPYWTLRFAPDARLDETAAAEELDRLLRDAVREQLVSDVPLGVWASGGIDSSTLLHYAAELGRKAPQDFSPSPSNRSRAMSVRGSVQIARSTAPNIMNSSCSPLGRSIITIAEFAYYSDEPSADAGALPVWFLSKMSRRQ